jgi:hypothetical protein
MSRNEATRFIGDDVRIFAGCDACCRVVFSGEEESRRCLVGEPGCIFKDDDESSSESASIGEEGTIFIAFGDLYGEHGSTLPEKSLVGDVALDLSLMGEAIWRGECSGLDFVGERFNVDVCALLSDLVDDWGSSIGRGTHVNCVSCGSLLVLLDEIPFFSIILKHSLS